MALQAAVRAGDLAQAYASLRAGADPDRRDPEGLTPLMVASGRGQPQMAELLLTAKADVLAVEPRMGATALHKAALSGSTDVIVLLLDHGAFIDQQSPIVGNTALMDAVEHRHAAAVRLLLRRGAKTTLRNHYCMTALDLARRDGLTDISALIQHADSALADARQACALLDAAKAGDAAQVERLIASGCDLDDRAPMVGDVDDDYTALGIAAREGHADVLTLLLAAGADPRRVNGLMRATPGHEAAYAGHADALRSLTAHAAQAGPATLEIDAQGAYNGYTALHDAVWRGHLEAARALVQAGARLDLKSHAGLTPRQLALRLGYDDIAQLLGKAEGAQLGNA
ncbi:hypothetical protein CAL15_08945 [Bordetella genomosp. 13]|uniref:Uncharacterized protein n=2 Tax=Bordetella genomosp. 13 TaxID=463040 RepID=A0A1W6ZJ39_9BORD|nr:hypothetical protein CAL15_08945 [Bordetella genomosp. 13]